MEKKYQNLYKGNRWGEEREKYLGNCYQYFKTVCNVVTVPYMLNVHLMPVSIPGLVTNLDDQVATVVDKLRTTGLYNNTMIIFLSDVSTFLAN